MKKVSMKQLLINAMEEYGNTLILSERIWSRFQPVPQRAQDKYKIFPTHFWRYIQMKNEAMKNMVKSMEMYGKLLHHIGY